MNPVSAPAIFSPTFWDEALVLPIILMAGLTFAAFVQVMATPRIFRKPVRRIGAGAALIGYCVLILAAGPEAVSGRWQADAALFVRSCLQAIPSVVLLMVLRKLERTNIDRPLKAAPWRVA